MSHDMQAAWASTEVADQLMLNQNVYFSGLGTPGGWSVYSGRESGREWPLADGVILAENVTSTKIKIALEYKRVNEGLHGVLTALGQSLAYLEKGYDASAVVIPKRYISHATPGEHLKSILDSTTPDSPVTVFTYDDPDPSSLRPFKNKLTCVREIELQKCRKATHTSALATKGDISTLWAHIREGMSYPDAFYRYCQGVKVLSSLGTERLSDVVIPPELISAINRIDSKADPFEYLSYTSGNTMSDKAWRDVWFRFYFWNDLMPIYLSKSPYRVNAQSTLIEREPGKMANLFSGRRNSIKNKLCALLNDGKITEDDAWIDYAKKVRKDAHSYREVIDSGLFHIGFLLPDGNLTDLGYKFVDACERISSANTGIPLEILRAALIENGHYGTFLHYIYQLSEERFDSDNFAFTVKNTVKGEYSFDKDSYLSWIADEFANNLHIMKTSTLRAGGSRKPFQAEIAFLRKMGLINNRTPSSAFRIGVGLDIDWPKVQNSMMYFQTI